MFITSEVRESGIFGKGLFATQRVRKGTIVCTFTLGARVTTEAEYVAACAARQQPIMRTGTRYAGRYFTYGNEHEPYNFINHSFGPNLLCHCGVVVALRDIETDEELTLDYRYLIDPTDVGLYHDAATGREIRGFPARETFLRTARQFAELVKSLDEWDG